MTFGDNHRNAGYVIGDEIAVWEDDKGEWWAVIQGIGCEGHWYESDDIGPYATKTEVITAAEDYYATFGKE